MSAEVHLVIPAFEEGVRLPPFLQALCEEIDSRGLDGRCVVMVVDDCSSREEAEAMRVAVDALREKHAFLEPLCRQPKNLGKGGAVYAGWEAAGVSAEWLGFVDADGAINGEETVRLVERALGFSVGEGGARRALFAVRRGVGGKVVERSLLRGLLGKLFALLARVFFRLPVDDTQCGLKLVPAKIFEQIRPGLAETGFCFDIELAYRITEAGVGITAEPISWKESAGSKLGVMSVVRMGLRMLCLRWKLGGNPMG